MGGGCLFGIHSKILVRLFGLHSEILLGSLGYILKFYWALWATLESEIGAFVARNIGNTAISGPITPWSKRVEDTYQRSHVNWTTTMMTMTVVVVVVSLLFDGRQELCYKGNVEEIINTTIMS